MKPTKTSIICPFSVLIDTREQLPYYFASIHGDARHGCLPVEVRTGRIGLPAGDYSIFGYVNKVAIERKSLADLCGTLTTGRMRFVRELEELNDMDAAWVVCEAELSTLMWGDLGRSKVCRKTLWRSVMAWQVRFPRVHWWGCPGRDVAEQVTFRLLEKWWWERVGKELARSKRKQVVKQHGLQQQFI